MTHILAIDLGKFKSVACEEEKETMKAGSPGGGCLRALDGPIYRR